MEEGVPYQSNDKVCGYLGCFELRTTLNGYCREHYLKNLTDYAHICRYWGCRQLKTTRHYCDKHYDPNEFCQNCGIFIKELQLNSCHPRDTCNKCLSSVDPGLLDEILENEAKMCYYRDEKNGFNLCGKIKSSKRNQYCDDHYVYRYKDGWDRDSYLDDKEAYGI